MTCVDWGIGDGSRERGVIAAGTDNGKVIIISPDSDGMSDLGRSDGNQIVRLALNRITGNALLELTNSGEVVLRDISTSKSYQQKVTVGMRGKAESICWYDMAQRPSIYAVGADSGEIRVWDVRTTRLTHSLTDASQRTSISAVCFNPRNEHQFLSGSDDARNSVVCLWDLRSPGNSLRAFRFSSGVLSLTAVGECGVAGLLDGSVVFVGLEEGEIKSRLTEVGPVCHLDASRVCEGLVLAGSKRVSLLSCSSFITPQARGDMSITFDGRVVWALDDSVTTQMRNVQDRVIDLGGLAEVRGEDELESYARGLAKEDDGELGRVFAHAGDPDFPGRVLNASGLVLPEIRAPMVDAKPKGTSVDALFGEPGVSDDAVWGGLRRPIRVLPDQGKDEDGFSIGMQLVLGSASGAVDVAMSSGRWMEAMMIAAFAGGDLARRVVEKYAAVDGKPLSRLMAALCSGDLTEFVATAKVKHWLDVFAVISSHGRERKVELFQRLGQRLQAEGFMVPAIECFVAAKDPAKVADVLGRVWADGGLVPTEPVNLQGQLEQLCCLPGGAAAAAPVAEALVRFMMQSGAREEASHLLEAVARTGELEMLRDLLRQSKLGSSLPARTGATAEGVGLAVGRSTGSGFTGPGSHSAPKAVPQFPLPVAAVVEPPVRARPPIQALAAGELPPETRLFVPSSGPDPLLRRPGQQLLVPAAPLPVEPSPSASPSPVVHAHVHSASPLSRPVTGSSAVAAPGIFRPGAPVAPQFQSNLPAPPVVSQVQAPVAPPPSAPPPLPVSGSPPTGGSTLVPSFWTSGAPAPPPAILPVSSPGSVPIPPPAKVGTFVVSEPSRVVKVAAAAPVERKSPQASVDELPSALRSLGQRLERVIVRLEEDGPRKGLVDVKTKFPLALGNLRDGKLDAEALGHLENFVGFAERGEWARAGEIRVIFARSYMRACQDMTLLLLSILNAAKK